MHTTVNKNSIKNKHKHILYHDQIQQTIFKNPQTSTSQEYDFDNIKILIANGIGLVRFFFSYFYSGLVS